MGSLCEITRILTKQQVVTGLRHETGPKPVLQCLVGLATEVAGRVAGVFSNGCASARESHRFGGGEGGCEIGGRVRQDIAQNVAVARYRLDIGQGHGII